MKVHADPGGSPPALDATQSRFVANTWASRASSERAAALRFERLTNTLRASQAPQAVVDLAQRAVVDERRHIGLCDGLAAHFGWTDPPLPPGPHAAIGPPQASASERLLYEMVSSCCLRNPERLHASGNHRPCPVPDDPGHDSEHPGG